MPRPILADAFGHHVWATLRLLDTCASLSDEQLDREEPGTFGSIRGTLRHLVGADASYLHLLSDGAVPELEDDSLTIPDMQAAMQRHAPVWSQVVGAAEDPDRVVIRHRDDGSQSLAPLGIRLAQVVHHGSDHRSQVCTALTVLGITPPEIDAWDFAHAHGRLSETAPSS